MKNKKQISEIIDELRPNDVILGRGNAVSTWVGNIKFRRIIWNRRDEYSKANRNSKGRIATSILSYIESIDGRFIELIDEGTYVVVDDARAHEKTCQALREKKVSEPKSVDLLLKDDYYQQFFSKEDLEVTSNKFSVSDKKKKTSVIRSSGRKSYSNSGRLSSQGLVTKSSSKMVMINNKKKSNSKKNHDLPPKNVKTNNDNCIITNMVVLVATATNNNENHSKDSDSMNASTPKSRRLLRKKKTCYKKKIYTKKLNNSLPKETIVKKSTGSAQGEKKSANELIDTILEENILSDDLDLDMEQFGDVSEKSTRSVLQMTTLLSELDDVNWHTPTRSHPYQHLAKEPKCDIRTSGHILFNGRNKMMPSKLLFDFATVKEVPGGSVETKNNLTHSIAAYCNNDHSSMVTTFPRNDHDSDKMLKNRPLRSILPVKLFDFIQEKNDALKTPGREEVENPNQEDEAISAYDNNMVFGNAEVDDDNSIMADEDAVEITRKIPSDYSAIGHPMNDYNGPNSSRSPTSCILDSFQFNPYYCLDRKFIEEEDMSVVGEYDLFMDDFTDTWVAPASY